MSVSNLDLEPTQQNTTAAQGLMSFLCPCCGQRLNVPIHLAGIAGPCPACENVIRAPQVEAYQRATAAAPLVSTSEIIVSDSGAAWDAPDEAPADEVPVVRSRIGDVRRIAAPPEEELDDSWREKVARERRQTRKRVRRTRRIEAFLASHTARRIQRVGTIAIVAILGATMLILYLNNRSGGALLRKVFGH